jgi:hypothetical protein
VERIIHHDVYIKKVELTGRWLECEPLTIFAEF